MEDVTLYTLEDCPWCVRAKKLLSAFGMPYTEVNGKFDNYPTVPYVVIDGKGIGGFTELAAYCRNHL
jgi:glutaredoxin